MQSLEFIRSIMPEIEKYFISNGRTYVIDKEFDYFKETLTLFAKQHNLIESIILLLDNGMNEEAYVLARSVLNNYFLICYILEDKKRIKEYQIQPLISELKYWRKVKESLNGDFGQRMKQQGKNFTFTESDIDKKIDDINNEIIKSGVTDKNGKPVKQLLSIMDLAGKPQDNSNYELYATYYMEASKYEHSDISVLSTYRESEEVDSLGNSRFVMNMSRTDTALIDKIKFIVDNCYLESFRHVTEVLIEIIRKNSELTKCYNVEKLVEISQKTLDYTLSL